MDPEQDAPEGSPEDRVYQEIMRSFGGLDGVAGSWEHDLPDPGGLWPGEADAEEDQGGAHRERGDPHDTP